MKKLTQMENILNNHIDNIILKSNCEDWIRKHLMYKNIKIEITNSNSLFYVYIYENNIQIYYSNYEKLKWYSLRRIRIKKKQKEILNFLKDKDKYEGLKIVMDSLSLKQEIRKEKLKTIGRI